MDNYVYTNPEMWWTHEDPPQDPYVSYSYIDEPNAYDTYENNWQWTNDNLYQNSAENPYTSYSYNDEYYSNDHYDNECRWTHNSAQKDSFGSLNKKLDQVLDLIETLKREKESSNSILRMERDLEQMEELVYEQPLDDLSDTTLVNEVTFLPSEDFYDSKMHTLTPPELEVVVEDYAYLDDSDTENLVETKDIIIDLEVSNETKHDLEMSQVGEGCVENNTTPYPTILKNPEKQPLLFEPTNDPPMNGKHFMVDTMDDYVYEHTTYMLSNTAQELENCFSCDRSKELDHCGTQNGKKKTWDKKYDATHSRKSKMKVVHDMKPRLKNFTRRKDAWLVKAMFKRSHGKFKTKRLCEKVKISMPYDPGGIQAHKPGRNKGNESIHERNRKIKMVDLRQLTYYPP